MLYSFCGRELSHPPINIKSALGVGPPRILQTAPTDGGRYKRHSNKSIKCAASGFVKDSTALT